MKLYSNVSIIFLIWVGAVVTIFYLGFSTIPQTDLFPRDFIKNLANWDGGHYLGIADGYDKAFQYVFFPLYPILINLVSKFTGSFLTAGLLVSLVSIFLAVNILYNLVKSEFGKEHAGKSLLALLFFPLSFHFLTVYTESLFLFLTLATFLFARNRKFLPATLCAGLASATRLAGLATVLSLVLSVYLTEGINRKNWWVIFSPLGFLMYVSYLYIQTGDPFYFVSGQSAFWQGGLVLPGSAVVHSLRQILTTDSVISNFRVLLDFAFTTFGIFTVWKVLKKLSLDYAIFSIASLILPMFSPTIAAMPRYLLTIFPIFIVWGFYKNEYLNLAYQVIALMLLSVYAILFINGY
ncbi:hypothetical protein HYW43_00720, partial [Candidatus Daviesbacteria bacterium]|nr:hypothetical protein [Candidatus Daviesbacteria bacterium]